MVSVRDVHIFEIICWKIAVVYFKNYPWYPMPTTPDNVFTEGLPVIKKTMVSLSLLSEEVEETKGLYLFHNLLVSSDSCMSSKPKEPKMSGISYPDEIFNYLEYQKCPKSSFRV